MNRYHIHLTNLDARFLIPEISERNFFSYLSRLIRSEDIQLLHAQPDVLLPMLAERAVDLPTKVMLPKYSTIMSCQDKMKTQKLLNEADVAVPESYLVENEESLFHSIQLLKDSGNQTVWLRAVRGAGSRAAIKAASVKEAKHWIEWNSFHKNMGWGDFMVAEYLPGKDFAFASVWKHGKLLSSFARERVQYLYGFLTPSGTSSTPSVARSIRNDEVNSVATRAIQAVDSEPNGIYCVDLKSNQKGTPMVTEINAGRFFTTSLFYATVASRFNLIGCNLPYVYVKAAFDEEHELSGLQNYNLAPEDLYWVRMVDMGERCFTQSELDNLGLLLGDAN